MGITNVNYDEVVAEENKPSHVNMDDRNRLRKDEDKEAFNEFQKQEKVEDQIINTQKD